MPKRSMRSSCFSIVRRTRPGHRAPPDQAAASREQADARSQCTGCLTPPRWNATPCRATRIFSSPIQATRLRDGFVRSLLRVAKLLPGFAPTAATRRRPTGLTCGAIQAGLMPWDARRRLAILTAALEPPPAFAALTTTCRRRRPTRSSMSIVRCFTSAIRTLTLCRHRRHRFFPAAAAAGFRRPVAADRADRLFILPQPLFVPIPVMSAAALRGAAAEQHHLQQHPQHDGYQQRHQSAASAGSGAAGAAYVRPLGN